LEEQAIGQAYRRRVKLALPFFIYFFQ